jgi:16S rRNA processing protein RimM
MADAQDMICVGFVRGPHGIKGMVAVRAHSGDPDSLFGHDCLFDKTGERQFKLKLSHAKKDDYIVKISGIETRNDAEAAKGLEFYVPATQLPDLKEEEFYHKDLIGLTVLDDTGAKRGVIRGIYDFGSGDTLDILFDMPENKKRVEMVLFTKEYVPTIDIKNSTVTVNIPEGLLDDAKRPQPTDDAS